MMFFNITYAKQAWGGYLPSEQMGKTNAFCKRSFKYGVVKTFVIFQED